MWVIVVSTGKAILAVLPAEYNSSGLSNVTTGDFTEIRSVALMSTIGDVPYTTSVTKLVTALLTVAQSLSWRSQIRVMTASTSKMRATSTVPTTESDNTVSNVTYNVAAIVLAKTALNSGLNAVYLAADIW